MRKKHCLRHCIILWVVATLPGIAVPDTFICCYRIEHQQTSETPDVFFSRSGTMQLSYYYFNLTGTINFNNNLSNFFILPIDYQRPKYDFSSLESFYNSLVLMCIEGKQNNIMFSLRNENRIDFTMQQGQCEGTSLLERSRDFILRHSR